jgi:hypothetical protein
MRNASHTPAAARAMSEKAWLDGILRMVFPVG